MKLQRKTHGYIIEIYVLHTKASPKRRYIRMHKLLTETGPSIELNAKISRCCVYVRYGVKICARWKREKVCDGAPTLMQHSRHVPDDRLSFYMYVCMYTATDLFLSPLTCTKIVTGGPHIILAFQTRAREITREEIFSFEQIGRFYN